MEAIVHVSSQPDRLVRRKGSRERKCSFQNNHSAALKKSTFGRRFEKAVFLLLNRLPTCFGTALCSIYFVTIKAAAVYVCDRIRQRRRSRVVDLTFETAAQSVSSSRLIDDAQRLAVLRAHISHGAADEAHLQNKGCLRSQRFLHNL